MVKQLVKQLSKTFFIALILAATAVGGMNFTHYIKNLPAKNEIKKGENYFPIESFVKVHQDILTFEMLCDEQEENCTLSELPTNRVAGTGSGVIIGEREGKSLVLTAGHVCTAPGNSEMSMGAQYVMDLETGFGHTARGTVLAIDVPNDLCLVIADENIGPALVVADDGPLLHDKVYTMGSPFGLAAPLAVPVFDGYFSGHVEALSIYSIPAAPGSSGSPIMNEEREIISIISAAAVSFDEYAIGCKTQALRNFLIANDVF